MTRFYYIVNTEFETEEFEDYSDAFDFYLECKKNNIKASYPKEYCYDDGANDNEWNDIIDEWL